MCVVTYVVCIRFVWSRVTFGQTRNVNVEGGDTQMQTAIFLNRWRFLLRFQNKQTFAGNDFSGIPRHVQFQCNYQTKSLGIF